TFSAAAIAKPMTWARPAEAPCPTAAKYAPRSANGASTASASTRAVRAVPPDRSSGRANSQVKVRAIIGTRYPKFARTRTHAAHAATSPLPGGTDLMSRRLAAPVHLTLYALMFIIPIFGIVTFVWHGRVLDLGLYQVNVGIRKNRAVFEPTEDIHGYLAYTLFALASVHVLAGLWHHFVRRDGILARMWPARGT